jgi:hypothetical protein
VDNAAICQSDGTTRNEVTPFRAGRHAKQFGLFNEKRPAWLFFKTKAKTTRPAVVDLKGAQLKLVVLYEHPGRYLNKLDFYL